MGRPRAQRRGAPKQRLYDWREGLATFDETSLTQQNLTLLGPVGTQEHATVTRIVGRVSVVWGAAQIANLAAVGHYDGIIACGIQIVNRAAAAPGVARKPELLSDREGGEWMWLRQYRRSAAITADAAGGGAPADWWIPTSETGQDDTMVDIKVRRRIDLSQDEVLFSHTQVNRVASGSLSAISFFVRADLRLLLQV